MKWFKRILIACLVLVLLVVGGLASYILLKGRAPARRPDLVTPLAEGIPPAPHGYPSEYSAFLMAYLFYDLIDIENYPTPPDVIEKTDIVFGKGGDTPLVLDVYSTAQEGAARPAIIIFYGGSWKGGNKEQLKCYAVHFAQQGYVAVTPQYRLKKAGEWPNSVQDAKCAVRWLRSHAEEYGVDPDRIGVMGNSAGAYLALMVAYTPEVEDFEGDGGWEETSSAVKAVVEIYGPTDFTDPARRDHNALVDYMGGHYEQDPDRFVAASPVNYVTAQSPPTCIIHGTVDMLVPVQHGDGLAEKLKAAGVPYVYSRINGWPHAMDAVASVNEHSRALALDFFNTHL